jgi:hypothetical protein
MGLVALLCVLALVALALWLNARSTPKAQHHPFADYPELFVESVACPHRGSVPASGRRLEELARLRSDRYAYDPGDGVRAVHHYQEAESCYRDEGNELGARRVRRALAALTVQVNTDYAAARLNLSNALEQERWSAAFSELRRLLLLTHHIGRDEYVEWLRRNIGRVAAKASAES